MQLKVWLMQLDSCFNVNSFYNKVKFLINFVNFSHYWLSSSNYWRIFWGKIDLISFYWFFYWFI